MGSSEKKKSSKSDKSKKKVKEVKNSTKKPKVVPTKVAKNEVTIHHSPSLSEISFPNGKPCDTLLKEGENRISLKLHKRIKTKRQSETYIQELLKNRHISAGIKDIHWSGQSVAGGQQMVVAVLNKEDKTLTLSNPVQVYTMNQKLAGHSNREQENKEVAAVDRKTLVKTFGNRKQRLAIKNSEDSRVDVKRALGVDSAVAALEKVHQSGEYKDFKPSAQFKQAQRRK